MKRVKACLNENCPEFRKRYFKASDEYCLKCGQKLHFVCKAPHCFKAIPDDKHVAYCIIHQEEKKDKKDRRMKKLVKVGGSIVASVTVIAGSVKTAADLIKKK